MRVKIGALMFLGLVFTSSCLGQPQSSLPRAQPQPNKTTAVTSHKSHNRIFTLDELTQFDGKKGKPAYIAVNGIVYDVTEAPWRDALDMLNDKFMVVGSLKR